jgi:hypothetical protein
MQACLSKIGPGLSHLMASATKSIKGKAVTSKTPAIIRSAERLI